MVPVIMAEDSDTECIHLLIPEACRQCQHGPELQKKPKPRKKRQQPKLKVVDPAEQYLMEYLSGARCLECDTLRTGAEFQCSCERAAIADEHIEAINEFVAANPGIKGKLVETAASAALSRVTLRAGLRNAPSPIEGMGLGSLMGLMNRVSNGRAMEWKPNRKGGDELPV